MATECFFFHTFDCGSTWKLYIYYSAKFSMVFLWNFTNFSSGFHLTHVSLLKNVFSSGSLTFPVKIKCIFLSVYETEKFVNWTLVIFFCLRTTFKTYSLQGGPQWNSDKQEFKTFLDRSQNFSKIGLLDAEMQGSKLEHFVWENCLWFLLSIVPRISFGVSSETFLRNPFRCCSRFFSRSGKI